jgi:hypothetical protein
MSTLAGSLTLRFNDKIKELTAKYFSDFGNNCENTLRRK